MTLELMIGQFLLQMRKRVMLRFKTQQITQVRFQAIFSNDLKIHVELAR